MKRVIRKEIDRCTGCHLCEEIDGFAHHQYECIYYKHKTNWIDDSESATQAEMQMAEWFKKLSTLARIKRY